MYDFTHQWQLEVLANDTVTDEYEVRDSVFVEGRKGSQLKLRLTNDSDEPVMFVPSLDGLSIYDEQPASLTSRGVIVDPHKTVDISHWGVSNDVLEFVGNKSFEKRTGKGTDNVGVIGCVVFRKKNWVKLDNEIQTKFPGVLQTSTAASTTNFVAYSSDPVMSASLSSSDPFAGQYSYSYKDLESSYDDDVFVKRDENYPDAFITIFYDSVRGLEKRGIVMKYKSPHTPDAFPVSRGARRR